MTFFLVFLLQLYLLFSSSSCQRSLPKDISIDSIHCEEGLLRTDQDELHWMAVSGTHTKKRFHSEDNNKNVRTS